MIAHGRIFLWCYLPALSTRWPVFLGQQFKIWFESLGNNNLYKTIIHTHKVSVHFLKKLQQRKAPFYQNEKKKQERGKKGGKTFKKIKA